MDMACTWLHIIDLVHIALLAWIWMEWSNWNIVKLWIATLLQLEYRDQIETLAKVGGQKVDFTLIIIKPLPSSAPR